MTTYRRDRAAFVLIALAMCGALIMQGWMP